MSAEFKDKLSDFDDEITKLFGMKSDLVQNINQKQSQIEEFKNQKEQEE